MQGGAFNSLVRNIHIHNSFCVRLLFFLLSSSFDDDSLLFFAVGRQRLAGGVDKNGGGMDVCGYVETNNWRMRLGLGMRKDGGSIPGEGTTLLSSSHISKLISCQCMRFGGDTEARLVFACAVGQF